MKFGPVNLTDAEGAILAHSLVLADRRLKKGHVLTKPDIESAAGEGIADLVVARLETGDIAEDEAARRLAVALIGGDEMFDIAPAATGRVNIYAKQAGLFECDAAAIAALNAIDEGMTFATLADDTFVEQGRMVATVKIIPFAVSDSDLSRFETMAAQPVLRVSPARSLSVALVATLLPSLKSSVMHKTRRVLEERLAASGSVLSGEVRVAHKVEAVQAAIEDAKDEADLIILFGASAIADRRDVLPEAVRRAGGTVHYFGMPMDPGNLLMWGSVGNVPVIGAPGCARSPAENGFDKILARIVTDTGPSVEYIQGLGAGGLLMEITSRPQPREG